MDLYLNFMEVKFCFFVSESWEQSPMSLVFNLFQQASKGSFRNSQLGLKNIAAGSGQGAPVRPAPHGKE